VRRDVRRLVAHLQAARVVRSADDVSEPDYTVELEGHAARYLTPRLVASSAPGRVPTPAPSRE
jgi:hypothetical protein